MGGILYFNCQSGISGDMTLGALLDLGVDQDEVVKQLNFLDLDGYRLEIGTRYINGIKGTDFNVILDPKNTHHETKNHSDHHHRNLNDIEKIIDQSKIHGDAKELSKRIFKTVAVAEAKVHGKSIDNIHFHEVGAVDSIVDIVGTAICLTLLNVDAVYASPLHLGSGFVTCSHGKIPIPAPATLEILKEVPVYSTGTEGELVTPTGAAIIKSITNEFGPLPKMTIENIGIGTGKNNYDIPNMLRIFHGQYWQASNTESEDLMVLETNIDDMNPELTSYLVPLLFEKGALDVYITYIIMKKGRPGIQLNILCTPQDEPLMSGIVFKETPTLGIRKQIVQREYLTRKNISHETPLGKVNIKAAYHKGEILKMAPEYEDCKKIAQKKKIPLREVYELVCKNIPMRNPG